MHCKIWVDAIVVTACASRWAEAWSWTSLVALRPASRGFDGRYTSSSSASSGSNITANDAIPNADIVAAQLGVRPLTRAPGFVWKFVWRGQGFLLPLLHWRDPAVPRNSAQNLKVVWNKAIASMDRRSPVYEARPNRWTMDLLPWSKFWLLVWPTFWLPRLHHANIELRTAYLNRGVERQINTTRADTPVRLISLGAGFDARAVKLLTEGSVCEAQEVDLPDVVESKRIMLQRLRRRRLRRGQSVQLPQQTALDLNDLHGLWQLLRKQVSSSDGRTYGSGKTFTIVVLEAVLIYLDKGIPTQLFQTCYDADVDAIVFADRLENVERGDIKSVRTQLQQSGWKLIDWQPKPGLARHMGVVVRQ